MKLFKKNSMNVKKLSKGKQFLHKLQNAVKLNEKKEKFQTRFSEILKRADEPQYKGMGTLQFEINLKKELENNDKPMASSFKTGREPNKKKFRKFTTKLDKFKLKIKNTWLLTKEFGRIIKNWAIVEYNIIRKLTYALNKKKEEVKIRKAFESNMINFVNAHGYDKGMQKYDKLVRGIQYSINFDKRLEKLGR